MKIPCNQDNEAIMFRIVARKQLLRWRLWNDLVTSERTKETSNLLVAV